MWKKGMSKKTDVEEGDIKEEGHRGREHQERGQMKGMSRKGADELHRGSGQDDVKERDSRGRGMWKKDMSIKTVIEKGDVEEGADERDIKEGDVKERGCGL